MDSAYRIFSSLVSPLMPLWLLWRRLRGKEETARIKERYGIASLPRPQGKLLWLHAASVGEANSVLLLIEKIRASVNDWDILLTTGTVTSARLMKKRLPKGVIHQYAPLDTPLFTRRFIRHWKPDLACFVESELWPNLIAAANAYECFMVMINARMSERSFAFWQKHPAMIRRMLEVFDGVFAQSGDDAKRLSALGAKDVINTGNLKYDAALLPCDEAELVALKNTIGTRPVWLAASTHPGEETMVARVHSLLSATRPNLLTVIVPRHPQRGVDIATDLHKRFRVALRSGKDAITPETQFYIADTLGELGLFYRLCETVFMGGSLVKHGGQNPLEPARLSCAITTGPHTHNFTEVYSAMEKTQACLRVNSAENLAAQLDRILRHPELKSDLQARARQWVEAQGGAAERLLDLLLSVLDPKAARP